LRVLLLDHFLVEHQALAAQPFKVGIAAAIQSQLLRLQRQNLLHRVVEQIAKSQGITISELILKPEFLSKVKKDDLSVGVYTLTDILEELKKPKPLQKLTEDFFIEMERSLKTVERAMPDVLGNKDRVRRTLIQKFRKGVIKSRVDFRMVSKIARAERLEVQRDRAATALRRLFTPNDYSIEAAFAESVSEAYLERDLLTRLRSLLEKLRTVRRDELDPEILETLRALRDRVSELLGM